MMRRGVYLATVAILLAAALLVPLPVSVVQPGLAASITGGQDQPGIVTIDGADGEVNGQLLLTAVTVTSRSTVGTLEALVDPADEVSLRGSVVPAGIEREEFLEIQQRIFEESVRVAAAAGSRAAGLDVTVSGEGARVVRVVPDSPADGALREGDVIVGAAGRPIELASELVDRSEGLEPGETVDLRVRRGDRTQDLQVRAGAVPGLDRPGIGVLVRTLGRRIELPVEVAPSDELQIGGPSAGLMLALTVYDRLDSGDLTAGRVVAGTGTIGVDGDVGPVGGVRAKVETARRAGAEVFLVPAPQADQARASASDSMEVVAVSTLEEAISALSR